MKKEKEAVGIMIVYTSLIGSEKKILLQKVTDALASYSFYQQKMLIV